MCLRGRLMLMQPSMLPPVTTETQEAWSLSAVHSPRGCSQCGEWLNQYCQWVHSCPVLKELKGIFVRELSMTNPFPNLPVVVSSTLSIESQYKKFTVFMTIFTGFKQEPYWFQVPTDLGLWDFCEQPLCIQFIFCLYDFMNLSHNLHRPSLLQMKCPSL